MKLDAVLRAHGFMCDERPPLLWEADARDDSFIRLVCELIAFTLCRSKSVSDLTLRVSNVVIDAGIAQVPTGDYVALTVRGPGRVAPELKWWPNAPTTCDPVGDLERAAALAGSAFVYTRNLGVEASITVLFRRASAGP